MSSRKPVIPTHVEASDTGITTEDSSAVEAGYQSIIGFVNKTGFTVTIVQRDGFKIEIPFLSQVATGIFRINRVHFCGAQIKPEFVDTLNRVTGNSSAETQIIKKIYFAHKRPIDHRKKFSYNYDVSIEVLEQYKSIYHPESDLLICLCGLDAAPEHPYSKKNYGYAESELRDTLAREDAYAIEAEYVNNEVAADRLFLAVMGRFYILPVKKDPFRANGVYLRGNSDIHSEAKPGCDHIEFIPLDVEKLKERHIYTTLEEARTYGNPKQMLDMELVKMEHANSVLKRDLQNARDIAEREKIIMQQEQQANERVLAAEKAEFELRKLQLEKENLEAAQRIKELEATCKQLEHDASIARMKRKDYYEELSSERKEQTEQAAFRRKEQAERTSMWERYMPAIVQGAITLMVGLLAIFRTSS